MRPFCKLVCLAWADQGIPKGSDWGKTQELLPLLLSLFASPKAEVYSQWYLYLLSCL